MKMYQLSNPTLDYNVIYLDEAQDTSACTLDIVKKQTHAKLVLVGDIRQSIYGWRGSVNAMELVDGVHRKLSKSFRFGPASSELACKVIQEDGLTSAEGLVTVVGGEGTVDRTRPYTILYRTNSALLIDALKEIETGKAINLEINASDLCRQLVDARHLYNCNSSLVKHETLLMYTSWEEVKEESKTNPELIRIIKLVQDGEVDRVINALNYHKNSSSPDITMTTAHKSKGREFDQVVLGDDFPSHYNQEGEWVGLTVEEQNLLYVGLTRAKKFLEYNSTIAEMYYRDNNVGGSASIKELRMCDLHYTDSKSRESQIRASFNAICNQEHRFNAFEDWLDNGSGLWDNRWAEGMGGELIDTVGKSWNEVEEDYE